jgi:hypothetical protein
MAATWASKSAIGRHMLLAMRNVVVASILLTAGSAMAQQPSVVISETDCRNLQIHRPAPDVKYRPGVDAQGRAVAPADLGNRTRIEPPREVTIDVTRRIADITNLQTGTHLYKAEANVARLTVRDGRVFYNDRPLGDRDQRAIAEACAQLNRK